MQTLKWNISGLAALSLCAAFVCLSIFRAERTPDESLSSVYIRHWAVEPRQQAGIYFCRVGKLSNTICNPPSGYNASTAMRHRRAIATNACNEYRDVLSSEYRVVQESVFSPNQSRGYVGNLSLTYCISHIGSWKARIEALFRILSWRHAVDEWDLEDPCTAKMARQSGTASPPYEPMEHLDYPGVYYHPRRAKKPCNLAIGMIAKGY